MSFGQKRDYTRTDRFGNPTKLVGCKPNKNGFPVGYLEIGNQLYKLEPSKSNNEKYSHWIKVTKIVKKSQERF